MNYLIIKLIILSLVLPLFLFIWRQLAKIWTTPSILVLEDVFNCDTVFETQLWLFYKKIFIQKWYIYTFMKIFFKTNLLIWFSQFQTQ
jgi:hypothetical protein